MISVQNLTKKYDRKPILDGINVTFATGKVYGIVGRNGAGKTTFFRCVAGLEVFQGAIETDIRPFKSMLGLLMAESYFIPKITGEEYIYLLAEARGVKLTDVEARNIFDLPLRQYVETYSTGMKKKLALTAVLLQKNECFILDEPFNGLDLESSVLLKEIILRLRALGKTILISSHIFSTLRDVCDTILVLNNGKFETSLDKEDFGTLEQQLKEEIISKRIHKLLI
jgi:ABC-2 type transport system ATP-binding protein